MNVNYYEILEISKTASADEVTTAYRKMAKVVHPDRGGNAAIFRLVNEAYEVLSDIQRRASYDLEQNSHGQTNAQQNMSSSNPVYTRVEDFYKHWKENRRRIDCPSEESIRAGGVRQLVRSSGLLFWQFSDTEKNFLIKSGNIGDIICGNCGFSDAITVVNTEPLEFVTPITKFNDVITVPNIESHLIQAPPCGHCSTELLSLKIIMQEIEKIWSEAIDVSVGDFILFSPGAFSSRIAFGPVIEGRAQNEFGLKSIRVADEFTGETKPVKKWDFVYGVWKQNDLGVKRFDSVRNWS